MNNRLHSNILTNFKLLNRTFRLFLLKNVDFSLNNFGHIKDKDLLI